MIDLAQKGVDPDWLALQLLEDDQLFAQVMQGISPAAQKSAVRENCSQAVMALARNNPDRLLPFWNDFMALLESDNGFSKYVAIHVIADLTVKADNCWFERDMARFYQVLNDERVMVVSHAAAVSGQIAHRCPRLADTIARHLMAIDQASCPEERKELIKGYVIQSLDEMFLLVTDQAAIIDFVQRQRYSNSPKTKKIAREFLKSRGLT